MRCFALQLTDAVPLAVSNTLSSEILGKGHRCTGRQCVVPQPREEGKQNAKRRWWVGTSRYLSEVRFSEKREWPSSAFG